MRPFTDKQIELVSTFADQAAIAIENVRLFDEIQEKSRQLELASEHKSQFVASMSHELRTPLNAIIGLTEMMVTNAARFGTEKAEEPLRRVHRAGTHLLGLINQVLDLSKIEAGKLELNPESVDLAPLIDEVIGTARQLAEQNKNRLVSECQDNLAPLTVDPMRLRQILLNLLSNACKFTKQGEVSAAGVRRSRRARLDRVRRLRYRHRHDGGAAGKAVRGIQPGRFLDRAAVRRNRARARHQPQARAHDGRRRHRGERAGQRLGVHRAPAGRHERLAKIKRWAKSRRTAPPRRGPGAASSPSHITRCPRTNVPTGQPVTRHAVIGRPAGARRDPAVGDGLAALEVDDGEIGVVAHGDAALARDAEQARRRRRWSGRPGAASDSRPALT